MLNEALQRNAKHEARLSNIADFDGVTVGRNSQRSSPANGESE
jgi:hypothetical protein